MPEPVKKLRSFTRQPVPVALVDQSHRDDRRLVSLTAAGEGGVCPLDGDLDDVTLLIDVADVTLRAAIGGWAA
jgi:hypothetical protein